MMANLTEIDIKYLQNEIAKIKDLATNGDASNLARPLRHLTEKILQYPGCVPRSIANSVNALIFQAQNFETRRVSDPSWGYLDTAADIVRQTLELADEVLRSFERHSATSISDGSTDRRREPEALTRPPANRNGGKANDVTPRENRPVVSANGDGAAVIETEDLVLQVRDFEKRYKHSGFRLGPVSFDMRLGEILGVVGANGSGKSTLMEMLRGAIVPDSPRASIQFPFIQPGLTDWDVVRGSISYISQRTPRWHNTVRHNLEFAAALHGHRGEANAIFVDGLLARHELQDFKDHSWSQLSAGYRLRFEIALARIPRSRLFILDEPLANLDINSQQTFLEDIRQVATNRGARQAAVIVSSQHLYEIEAVADHMLVLNNGGPVAISKNKPEKVFEIWGKALDKGKLAACLEKIGAFKPVERTSFCLIRVPAAMEERSLVNALYEHGIEFTYFRNITDSVRLLFEPQDNRP